MASTALPRSASCRYDSLVASASESVSQKPEAAPLLTPQRSGTLPKHLRRPSFDNKPPSTALISTRCLCLFLFFGTVTLGVVVVVAATLLGATADQEIGAYSGLSPSRVSWEESVQEVRSRSQRAITSLLPWRNGDDLDYVPKKLNRKLRVCVASGDFWGLPTAGGTATALCLLASVIASSPENEVTFIGMAIKEGEDGMRVAHEAACKAGEVILARSGVRFECLSQHYFMPELVRTNYYEHLGRALLAWMEANPDRCDVFHNHEWGGFFSQMVTASHFRRLHPGFRVSTEPHGGHFWASSGQEAPISHLFALRQDNMERMSLQLADYVIAPSSYMNAYYRQRGWRLPDNNTLVIPNALPEVNATKEIPDQAKIWRLCFFSRLEERKGIKVFLGAAKLLASSGAQLPKDFEVWFVGAEHEVDMQPSSVWLAENTKGLPFPVHIKANVPRTEAIAIINYPGMLLVFASMVENSPYVVMESVAMGIPMLATDNGGTLEMLDRESSEDSVVRDNTPQGLFEKVAPLLAKGSMTLARFAPHVTSGKQTWLEWHRKFAQQLPRYQKEDMALHRKVAKLAELPRVIRLAPDQSSLDLWQDVCQDHSNTTANANQPLLLLPPEYELLEAREALAEMGALIASARLLHRGSGVAALAFGALLPSGKHSYPSAPTWMLYGDDAERSHCIESVPVLIPKDTFCSYFYAEARIFRAYQTWVLATMLRQAGLMLHTYPKTYFAVEKITHTGYGCNFDRFPVDRKLTFSDAAHLMGSSEDIMQTVHIAPVPLPLASLNEDYLEGEQGHNGWVFGSAPTGYVGPDSELDLLYWEAAGDGGRGSGRWGCGTNFPFFASQLVHPCAHAQCCGVDGPEREHTDTVVRYMSHTAVRKAQVAVAYTVMPTCGDGITVLLLHHKRITQRGRAIGWESAKWLAKVEHEKDEKSKGVRARKVAVVSLGVGDLIDLVINPRGSMDCDGVYIIEYKITRAPDGVQVTAGLDVGGGGGGAKSVGGEVAAVAEEKEEKKGGEVEVSAGAGAGEKAEEGKTGGGEAADGKKAEEKQLPEEKKEDAPKEEPAAKAEDPPSPPPPPSSPPPAVEPKQTPEPKKADEETVLASVHAAAAARAKMADIPEDESSVDDSQVSYVEYVSDEVLPQVDDDTIFAYLAAQRQASDD